MASNGRPHGAGKREAAALALAGGRTVAETASLAGVGERTLARWLAEDDAFRRRVGELRAEMIGRALGKMADGMADAADRLRQLLQAESEGVCLGAAKALLELSVKLRDTVEIEERLTALERREANAPWRSTLR
jgi:transposase-like protein